MRDLKFDHYFNKQKSK